VSEFEYADYVSASDDGSGPPPSHIRDQERFTEALPLCVLPTLVRQHLGRVTLVPYAATMLLPGLETASAMAVPDATWQGWEWPNGDSVLLGAHRHPELPRLRALHPVPGECRVEIAGRPMAIALSQVDVPIGTRHVAHVNGFLDDATSFFACVVSRTSESRDALLAALSTLEREKPADAEQPPTS
jgi:hypothetical protein